MVVGLLAAQVFSTAALGESKDHQPELPTGPQSEENCDMTVGCAAADFPDLHDLDAQEVILGPVRDCSTGNLTSVVLQIDFTHTWIGDLIFELRYSNAPGVIVSALCRPDLVGCETDGCCGCAGHAAGDYYWDDTAANGPLGEGANCFAFHNPGLCWKLAPETRNEFADFVGMPGGGDWTLRVVDGAVGDRLNLLRWVVWTVGSPTPIVESTWGQVKELYR